MRDNGAGGLGLSSFWPLKSVIAATAYRYLAEMPGGYLASTFLGVPKPQKTPVLGFSRHLRAARALRLGQKRLRHAELENPTPRLFGLENPF